MRSQHLQWVSHCWLSSQNVLVLISHTCSFDRSPVLWTTGGNTEDARMVRAILDSFAATSLR